MERTMRYIPPGEWDPFDEDEEDDDYNGGIA